MGTAHIVIAKSWLDQLRTQPDLMTIIRESICDNDTMVCVVESQLLPTGYHGEQVVVCTCRDPLAIKFVKDCDV